MFIEPKPVFLEACGIPALDSFSVGTFFEAFPELFVSEAQQAEEVKPVATGVVRHMRKFMRHNRPDARIGRRQYRRSRVDFNEVPHLLRKEEPHTTEPRSEVIGVAGERPNADIPVGKFREGASSDLTNQLLRPLRDVSLGASKRKENDEQRCRNFARL
jgi:hypothetical protein